jgi:OOP family OmpA-OmpF porin
MRTLSGCLLALALLLNASGPGRAGAAIRMGDPGGPDGDGDGVADDIDRCPERAGAFDNIGCPDRDEDGDGLVDRQDRCPTVAGPRAAFGCPSGDQAASSAVESPAAQAGSSSGAPLAQAVLGAAGLEVARLEGRRFTFAEPIRFAPGTDQLTPEGRAVVEAAAKVLLTRPGTRRVIIEGHVDEPGNTAARAKGLSSQRASAVRRALIELGLPAERLRARGFGYTRLLDRSETPAAALKNNRIEISVQD